MTNGASVRLTGKLTESPGAGQSHELQVDALEVLGECDPEVSRLLLFLIGRSINTSKTYPIQKQALTVDYLRDNAHLRARTDPVSRMLRLRDLTLRALHGYFEVC